MYKWIGEIIMTTMKTLTVAQALEMLTTGTLVDNVVVEAAERAEGVADLLEEIESTIMENQDENISM
jgi:hypothetical protein